MMIIRQGDDRVIKIITKKHLDKGARYKVSQFVYLYTEEDKRVLMNTLTKETVMLNEAEWKAFEQVRAGAVGYDFIVKNGIEQLAISRYLVEEEHNEVKQYSSVVFLLKTIAREKKGLKSYIIFPTTGCNARCVYCYEEGYAVRTMTKETADKLIDFICETKHNDKITLSWFGGEPTVCAKTISYICQELKKREVSFKSKMVTNASLITKELAHEMKERWKLERVQVSLDGAREDYKLRKQYISPKLHNYDVVMQAIEYLAHEGINVKLRCNFDSENIDRFKGFIDEMKERFGGLENVSLYLSMLYQEQHKEYCLDLYKEMFKLEDYISRSGLVHTVSKGGPKLKCNYCMADSIEKSIVITPDGVFNNCEHLPKNNTWGNIFDGVTDEARFNELNKPLPIDEKCAKCPFLPLCTPFYKNGCPGWFEKCYEFNCLKTEHSIHTLLKGGPETNDDHEEI